MLEKPISYWRRHRAWTLFVPLGVVTVVSSSCSRLENSTVQSGSSSSAGGGTSTNTTGSGESSAGGGSGTPTSGSSTGGGTASNGSSSGNSTGSGNGGTSNASGGGSMEMVVSADASVPDAGQMACTDTTATDSWSPGYSISATATSTAQSVVGQLDTTHQANIMRGTPTGCGGSLNYNDTFESGGSSGDPMTSGSTAAVREIKFRDGPRGVCLVPYSTVHPGKNTFPTGDYSTTFPSASARGAAFDMSLEQSIGQDIGDEIVAAGTTLVLAPVINILRHPAWGRSQETYGEDSFLLGRLGTAFVSGAQKYVPACAKHFMAYNIENKRESGNVSVLDEQTAYESYGRHFEMVVQDGGVACVMAAYNEIQIAGGTTAHCTSNPDLLTTMLRTTFGFQGFVVSDWWAVPGGQACNGSDTEKTYTTAAVGAGLDLEMPWDDNYSQLESVATPLQVKTGATRIAAQQARFNAMTPGQNGLQAATTTFNTGTYSIGNNTAHIQESYQAAIESMVLLKNTGNALPIASTVKTIAVLGASVPYALSTSADVQSGTVNFATDVRTGDLGSSRTYTDPATSTGPFAGIQTAAKAKGMTVVSGTSATSIPTADFYVVVAGMTPEDEGEEYTNTDGSGGDRLNFELDGKSTTKYQVPLIQAVAKQATAQNKPMVVVLEGGSVIDLGNDDGTKWFSSVPAVVMAWYPGQDGGHALGDLLFGNKNFSGKLPVTWPSSWNDEPAFTGPGGVTTMDYYVGYKYFDHYHQGYKYFDADMTTAAFPFGYGLSYTTFSYANLQVPCSTATKGSVVNVEADVTNSGTVDGDEVSFLFVSYPNTTQRRPTKELKGFHRDTIKAGQTVRVQIPLRVQDLKYWDTTSHSWKWENGPVQIMVGGSSDQLPLTGTMTVSN
jgi:beta-glucosidase